MKGKQHSKRANNIPVTEVIDNIILVIRIVIETKLVKRIDTIVLREHFLETVVVSIRVLEGIPWAGELTINVHATSTTNALPVGNVFAVALLRNNLEALLGKWHRELLIWVLFSHVSKGE
jgi:hypothetical protein